MNTTEDIDNEKSSGSTSYDGEKEDTNQTVKKQRDHKNLTRAIKTQHANSIPSAQ